MVESHLPDRSPRQPCYSTTSPPYKSIEMLNIVKVACRVTIDVTPTPIQKRLSPIEF